MTAAIVAIALATLICVVYGRYRSSSHPDAGGELPGDRRAVLDEARARMIVDAAMADDALLGAATARMAGDYDEACRLLDLGAWALSEATPGRLAHLRAMAAAVRMAAAIVPPPAIESRVFRALELRTLSAIGVAVHHVLVTPVERFLLRLWLLSCAFRLALRVMVRAAAALRIQPDAARYWERYVDGRADWGAADEEHLASFRLLLESVVALDGAHGLARR